MNTRIRIHQVALAAALAALSTLSVAQVAPSAAPPADGARGPQGHMGPRGPMGHGGPGDRMGHGPHRHGRGGGPVMMLLGPGLDRALDVAKATPEQRAEIRRIAGAARDDLRAARRGDRLQEREAWLAAWSADQVDTGAMERQRQQQAAQRDAAARRMVQAAADIGKVLKADQRRALAAEWRAQRPMMQRRAEADLHLDAIEHALAAAD